MREYSPEFRARLAAEIEALPPGTALEETVKDYIQLRDVARAPCR